MSENCPAGAKYTVIIESELNMDHRIVLQELKVRRLLSQSCVYSRELPSRRKYMIIIESEFHMCQRIVLSEKIYDYY